MLGSGLEKEEMTYNYRHSRARRISENAFGVLSCRWRIFRRTIETGPEEATNITKACIALHKYFASTDFPANPRMRYISPTVVDQELSNGDLRNAEWRSDATILKPVKRVSSNN